MNRDAGEPPARMMGVCLHARTGAEALQLSELAVPRPGPGEVLVKVHAAAITPSELKWSPTFTARNGRPRPFPIVLGHEFSGVIAGLGDGVTDFEVGDEVYGMNDWFANGAQAEFCVAP